MKFKAGDHTSMVVEQLDLLLMEIDHREVFVTSMSKTASVPHGGYVEVTYEITVQQGMPKHKIV